MRSDLLPVEEEIRLALLELTIAADRGDRNGVSQAELGRDLGITRQCVHKLLHGGMRFRFEYMPRLRERAFNVVMAAIHSSRPHTSTKSALQSSREMVTALTETASRLSRRLEDNEMDAGEEVATDLDLAQFESQIKHLRAAFAKRRGANVVAIAGAK